MTLQELLTSLTRDLHAAGTDAPALEARLLAGHVLHLDRIGLMLAMPSPVADDAAGAIRALTARRCAGEPLAHITAARHAGRKRHAAYRRHLHGGRRPGR